MAGEGGFAKQHLLTGHNAFYFDGEVFLSEIYGLVSRTKLNLHETQKALQVSF